MRATSTFTPSASTVSDAERSGVFAAGDLAFAEMVVRRAGITDPLCATALALAAKAVRLDHVCAELTEPGIALLWSSDEDDGPVTGPPASEALLGALASAGAVVEHVAEGADIDQLGDAPVVLSAHRCYLRRYAILEQLVADRLGGLEQLAAPPGLDAVLDEVAGDADVAQRDAVRRAFSWPVSVIAGGPGTGKTTTVALVLRVASALPDPLTVALAAPTGKAAARLDEAVRAAMPDADADVLPQARTLHRLLGVGRDGVARGGRLLDADVIVVDEASMVSLPLLAATLGKARPDARVILVGDPDQLASIEVGAVLADVVEAAAASSGVVVSTLTTAHRFEDARGVPSLAAAIRSGSVAEFDAAIAAHPDLHSLAPDGGLGALVARVTDHAVEQIEAARSGDADRALALVASLGVLCATKRGQGSTAWWNAAVESELVTRGMLRRRDLDYVGRPLLVTRTDALTGLTNGMIGVVVANGDDRRAIFEVGAFAPEAVAWAATVWALTIHKSQGSEYDEVVVSLPGPDSPILTRELIYTAVTRARRTVTLVAPAGSLQAALSRRVARSSGLAARLSGPPTAEGHLA
ncbi:MAG TPA: exodeoxyribonuclease V subunit alpha [Acidimicrobiales bacterium]|nr:exodeoxyribonuclease V subunit alpha [Acidimicrobiales bacterium]